MRFSISFVIVVVVVMSCAACGSGAEEGGGIGRPDAGGQPPSDPGRADGGDGAVRQDGGITPPADVQPPCDGGILPGDATADGGPADGGECGLSNTGGPDRDRVILLGQPFKAAGENGTEIRSMTLRPAGEILDDGVRLDVGARPARIEFTPSGGLALVLGEDGSLVSVRVDGAAGLLLSDRLSLPSADYKDIRITSDGTTAYVVGLNVDESSGISTVHIGCDGLLSVDEDAFFNVRLSDSFVLLPGEQRGVLLGGQTVFEPVDDNDLRLLGKTAPGWTEVAAFDVFQDFIETGRIAASPDGAWIIVPNGSPYSTEGGQAAVLSVDGDVLQERGRLPDLPDAREALFSPDGATALISLFEPGQIVVLADRGSGFEEVDRISGIGLADQMAIVERGRLAGFVLVPSVDPNGGPNLAKLQINGPGSVSDLGQFELGSGIPNIPGAVAVMK